MGAPALRRPLTSDRVSFELSEEAMEALRAKLVSAPGLGAFGMPGSCGKLNSIHSPVRPRPDSPDDDFLKWKVRSAAAAAAGSDRGCARLLQSSWHCFQSTQLLYHVVRFTLRPLHISPASTVRSATRGTAMCAPICLRSCQQIQALSLLLQLLEPLLLLCRPSIRACSSALTRSWLRRRARGLLCSWTMTVCVPVCPGGESAPLRVVRHGSLTSTASESL